MYFLKVVFSVILVLILIDGFTKALESSVDSLKKIETKTRELQNEVEKAVKSLRINCKPAKSNKTLNSTTIENATVASCDKLRQVNLVKYLIKLKRPVQDIGKLIHKSPDLEKIQTIVNQIKDFDFFKLDEDETETTVQASDNSLPDFGYDISKRANRNVFDDLSAKIKKFISGSKKPEDSNHFTTSETPVDKKQKRRTSGRLFNNINVGRFDGPIEYSHQKKVEEVNSVQENPIAQPSEDEKLLSDLNNFQSRLSVDQQMDISQFLDHIRDKPKPFKFDTSPYLQTQMEKLDHPSAEQKTDGQEDELFGARKFFDFDSSPVKRSLIPSQVDDYQKIAKLKSKLVAEYRQHHPMIDYADIFRQVEAKNNQRAEKTDVFLDHYYMLNDGSSSLDDVMKPVHSDHHVMSPYELNLNFQLEKEFKELDTDNLEQDQPKSDSLNADVPLYKPEIHSNAEADELSP